MIVLILIQFNSNISGRTGAIMAPIGIIILHLRGDLLCKLIRTFTYKMLFTFFENVIPGYICGSEKIIFKIYIYINYQTAFRPYVGVYVCAGRE